MIKKIINFLFHFLLFTTPFVFTWVNDELFEFPKMLFVYAITVLIATAWIIRMILEKKFIFNNHKFNFLLLFFLLSQLISTFSSIHIPTSIFGYYSRLHGGLLSTIAYLTLYFAFTANINRKQLKYFFYTLIFSSLLVSIYAIPEHFGHSFSCLLMFNEYNANCWKQDVINRVFASFGQPNWLAAYAVTLIPLTSSVFLIQNSIRQPAEKIKNIASYLPLISSILLFITLLFTKSRSGFLAFAISMGLYLLALVFLKIKNKLINSSSQRLVTLWVIFFILALAIGTPYTPSLGEILNPDGKQTLTENHEIAEMGGTDSGEIRKIVWSGAINIWKRYPLFGSGVETFAYSYYLDRPAEHNLVSEWDFLYNKAHNEFLNFLSTTGIVGLASYSLIIVFFIYSCLKYLSRARSRGLFLKKSKHKILALGLVSGYIALTISNFFGFSTVTASLLFFLYPAFFIVLTKAEIKNKKQEKTINLDIRQIIFIFLSLLASSYLLLGIFSKWLADYNYAQAKNYISENYLLEGINLLNTTISLSPNEALFYDQLSVASGKMAITLAQEENSNPELVSQFMQQAMLASDIALSLNPVHNNFYKSRSRLFITLSQLEPEFLLEAKSTLEQAILLAPTDPKLYYYLANVNLSLDETQTGIETLEKTIKLKANYGSARAALAQQYETQEDFAKAREQYVYILENINASDSAIQEKLSQLEK